MPRVCLVQSLTVAVIANMPSAHDEKDPPYQQDIRYVFKLNKWILGSIGIWPVSEQGFGRHASKIAIALGNLTLSFAMVPFALHIVYDEKDIIMRLKLSGLLAFCIVSMTKYCILAIRRPKIQQCIEYVKNDWWKISPIYEIVYVAHCLCGYTTYSITVGACGLAAVFVTHACGQIHMILLQLEDLLNGENSDIHQRIAIIVKDHVRVMRFSAVIEEILQEVCLVEFSSSVCTICLLEYYCIVDWQANNKLSLANYFLLFISFCFNIYILCYIGELLIEKSSQIGSVCFMINWYQLSPKSVRSLIMIIAISSNPIKLSAGRMVDLSLTTFGNVLKTSVAYLSFLRTLVM
ncbi:odorant receptor 13a isoform X3 [Monomorium pharaonis]|uniref:odorant receptor 13a isoform X3 n=1 Tax=Monomorium pharaonis TaxID=307658 RepID=UPI00102E191C|nr:odorant receptor 13a isoform X3 [Monomorium pharaonis]